MSDAKTSIPARSAASIRHHYEVERELATRLRDASSDDRRALYTQVYDELFQSVPDHPQLTKAQHQDRADRVRHKQRLVAPYVSPTTRLLEVGSGDGAFAAAMSERVETVVAMDVSEAIVAAGPPAPKVEMLLTNGTDVPVPPGTIDVAFSDQLMEHLHPDDARAQLVNIGRALRRDGWYVISTPSRWSGPHDISAHFDEVATGLHLHEYTFAELRRLLRSAGFDALHTYAGGRGRYLRVPNAVVAGAEWFVGRLPQRVRRHTARFLPIRAVLGLHVAARRGGAA